MLTKQGGHICMHTCTLTYSQTCTHTCLHTHIHTHTHTHTHTCIHTHTQTYTHTHTPVDQNCRAEFTVWLNGLELNWRERARQRGLVFTLPCRRHHSDIFLFNSQKVFLILRNHHRRQNYDSLDGLVVFGLDSRGSLSTHLGWPGECISASLTTNNE